MKNTFTLLLGLGLFLLGACKGDDPVAPVKKFADYTRADIVAHDAHITSAAITQNAPNSNFKTGSIIFFKTDAGNYGKMEIVGMDVDYKLTINVVVFKVDGSILTQQTGLVLVNNNDVYNLDDPDVPAVVSDDSDFGWSTLQGYRTLFWAVPDSKAYLFQP